MIASASLTREALHLQPGNSALLCLDTAFIAGKMMLVRSFITNMRIVAVNPAMNPFKALPVNEAVDFTALVPSQLDEILHSPEAERLNSIKNILIGGAALSDETCALLPSFTTHFYATYGMTETVSHIALQRLNGSSATPFFQLLPGIGISYDERKCLVIDASYLPDKIVTNDLVEIIDAEHFKWLGRIDNVINSGGIKIIPEKIERDLKKVFDKLSIQNAFFIGSIPDVKLGNIVVLLIEGDLERSQLEHLKSAVRNALGPYENPRIVYSSLQFVYTKSGKIDRGETIRLIQP